MSQERDPDLFGDALFHAIRYWILTPPPSHGFSPFQGYGAEILSREFIALVDFASILPTHPAELFLQSSHLGSFRSSYMQTQKSIIGEAFFEDVYKAVRLERTVDVVIGMPSEIRRAMHYADQHDTIFLSTDPIDGAVSLRSWVGHPSQVLDEALLSKIWPGTSFSEFAAGEAPSPRAALPAGEQPAEVYGVTIPNEILCLSLGADLSPEFKPDPSKPESYVDAIISSAEKARSLIGEDSINLILYSPSLIREHYQFSNSFWNKILREIKNKKARSFVKDGVFRNKNYSGVSLPDVDSTDMDALRSDPVVAATVGARQSELRACSSAIAALCCATVAPALRLPNGINFSLALLQEIERHAVRSDRRSAVLLQRSFITLVERLADEIHPMLLNYVEKHGENITVVADVPIEWLRLSGTPIMLRHDCSRIPMTPGNVMMSTCMESRMITIPSHALHDVLVVRSFKATDPISECLEQAVNGFPISKLKTKFVDVGSRAELIQCLNAFEGQIVIFDCHGGHGGDNAAGWLMIGNEKVDTWGLPHAARIPPIVVLSACSTFALAGSHASVANGLIRSGAVTVLGTFLPVDAVKSAIFTARILYRIDEFLPALSRLGRNYLTWKTLISTFLRMSYCTDVIRFFCEEKGILPKALSQKIGIASNYDVNNLNPRWDSNLIQRIAEGCGLSTCQAQEIIEAESPLMETMLYCQTGRPDRIGILISSEAD